MARWGRRSGIESSATLYSKSNRKIIVVEANAGIELDVHAASRSFPLIDVPEMGSSARRLAHDNRSTPEFGIARGVHRPAECSPGRNGGSNAGSKSSPREPRFPLCRSGSLKTRWFLWSGKRPTRKHVGRCGFADAEGLGSPRNSRRLASEPKQISGQGFFVRGRLTEQPTFRRGSISAEYVRLAFYVRL